MDEPPTHRRPTRRDTGAGGARGAAQRGGEPDNLGQATLVLGRYRLKKRLGAGAFGSVWSARDERLDRDVAVKLLDRERIVHARFEREARAAARLQHPGIVTLYEAAVDDEGAYLVSELVRGRTLDAALADGRLSDRDILEVGIALADALAHAHDQGVIHRDVKPSNVLVPTRSTGLSDRAKLTDFGVAHLSGEHSLTRTGDVIGTLAYMAPEQADGYEVGPLADLYSLALVLYEALTGVNPQADRRSGRARGARAWFIPPLRRQRRDLPRALAAGIDRALAQRPQDRGAVLELRSALAVSIGEAGTEPGVVAPGWGGGEVADTLVKDAPGPEWGQGGGRRWFAHDPDPDLDLDVDAEPGPRRLVGPRLGAGGLAGTGAGMAGGLTPWLVRAGNAAGAGFGGAWICAHALHWQPLAPAAIVLIVAVLALALPLAGSLLTAVALGTVSLAGGFPAVVGLVGRRWWQRALFGAAGFLLLAGIGRAAHHNLYWLPTRIPVPHPLSLAGAGVWAAACAVAPRLRTVRFPMLDVVLAGAWAAVTVAAVETVDVDALAGATVGGVVAAAILALPAVLAIVKETRESGAIHDGAA